MWGVFSFQHCRQLQFSAAVYQSARVFLAALVRGLVEGPALEALRQVLLGDPVLAVGVGIEIASAVAEAFGVAAGVLKVVGYFLLLFFFDRFQRVEKGQGRVALGRGRQVERGMG